MYLMDSLAKTADRTRQQGMHRNPVLSIYADMTRRMQGAPRFLMDNPSIAAAVEITLGRPLVMLQAMEHVRMPYPVMWVEWDESGRDRLREIEEQVVDALRPLPKRLGFLVEADEGGRTGCVTWVWATRDIPLDIPNVAAITAYFDLDSRTNQPEERIESFMAGNLAQSWKDNPIQLKALMDIWRTADHRPSPWGKQYLDSVNPIVSDPEMRFAMAMADVYGEYIIIWAIMLMLTASRQAVEYRPVDRTKINKARTKRRESLLFDHTEVVMHINRQPQAGEQFRSPLAYTRKSPRIHMVSRYLARRGDKHWIVEPYVRGSGETINRHIHVKG
jgi:hypothetical protein